jgi:hypothetical protein
MAQHARKLDDDVKVEMNWNRNNVDYTSRLFMQYILMVKLKIRTDEFTSAGMSNRVPELSDPEPHIMIIITPIECWWRPSVGYPWYLQWLL